MGQRSTRHTRSTRLAFISCVWRKCWRTGSGRSGAAMSYSCNPQKSRIPRFLGRMRISNKRAARGRLGWSMLGAHPDDCDIRVGGTATLWSQLGHAVKFVACTNGDAGHPTMGGAPLARRRRAEATEAGKRFGVTYDIVEIHDGELMPTLENRNL